MLEILNKYIHGYVAIPVILTCHKNNVFDLLEKYGPISLTDLAKLTKANEGHLHVALRLFQSLNWISKSENRYSIAISKAQYKKMSDIPTDILELYTISVDSLLKNTHHKKLLQKWLNYLCHPSVNDDPLMGDFIQGVVIVPLMIALKKLDCVDESILFNKIPSNLRQAIFRYFIHKKWAEKMAEQTVLTAAGRFMLERALNMAVAASHAPLLYKMQEILFGDVTNVFGKNAEGHELHIDRTLNVIGSGFQHTRYFDDVEEIIIALFNKNPVEKQPKYIIDTGCGDGTLLKKIYEIIINHTERGQVIDQFPLRMIGVDYNKKALIATQETLRAIPHLALQGDVSDPEKFIENLKALGIHDIENSLHVRSFLDHDRPYVPPRETIKVQTRSAIDYAGVFVDQDGQCIPSTEMIQSLVEHLIRWTSIISQHGLLILEVHCLSPEIINHYLEQNESLHFDALQAFTQQYLVSASDFLMCGAEAGLFPKSGLSRRYPHTFPYTRISLNYFEKKPYQLHFATRQDIPELIELEKACWPENLRIKEPEISQRIFQFPEGQLVVKMQGRIVGVIYTQKINDADALKLSSFHTLSTLHQPHGKIFQLLSVNIAPSMQDSGLGDQLIEFVLWWVSLMGGIEKIVGVTRCKNYVDHPALSIEDYVQAHIEKDSGIDPILRFHTNRGAEVKAILPNFRPEDSDNKGAGVLIEYALLTHSNKTFTKKKLEPKKITSKLQNKKIEDIVTRCITELMPEKYKDQFAMNCSLKDMGFDSLRLLELRTIYNQQLNIELEPTFFFEFNTPTAIANYLANQIPVENPLLSAVKQETVEPIAIIGMSCRFPGESDNPESFWDLLQNARSGITPIPEERKKILQNSLSYGGFLKEIDLFDANFFRISPREAELMDPQQRLLLALSWEALERAGIDASRLVGSNTGVFVGIFSHDYESLVNKNNDPTHLNSHFATGNSASIAAGRLSYVLGLQGPAMAINTACSSSLVAIHLACQSIRQNESDLALAAGVNLILSPELNVAFTQAGMLSPDGRCKTFDANADGYVRSEGCGVLVLKKMSKALADQDTILAVIRSSCLNQDGASNGLTAPNKSAQEKLLQDALNAAAISPEFISYLEAHGTGTVLGDPIEMSAIAAVYGNYRQTPLIIGSVKTNIGHSEAAAGMAGVIKAILMLQQQKIPANLHFSTLNPYIKLTDSFVFPTTLMSFPPASDGIRRAGVSSFGFSGTNAHLILEESVFVPSSIQQIQKSGYLFTISGKTEQGLKQRMTDLLTWLDNTADLVSLEEISYMLTKRRSHFEKRYAFVASSIIELKKGLQDSRFTQVSSDEWVSQLNHLARDYMQGLEIDWDPLYSSRAKNLKNFPTYPFTKERYWLTDKIQPGQFHPLLDTYTLTDNTIQASKRFSSNAFYFADHRVKNQCVLPGVVYLEMAYAAGSLFSSPSSSIVLTDIVWVKPLVLAENSTCMATLNAVVIGEKISFEISVDSTIHMQGNLQFSENSHPAMEYCNVSEIKKSCRQELTREKIYQNFKTISLQYGTTFQVIETCWVGEQQALSRLCFNDLTEDTYTLHPAILDGALQTAMQLFTSTTQLPFSIGNIDILHAEKIHSVEFVHIKLTAEDRLQITLLNHEGLVCLKMHDVCFRKLPVLLDEKSEMAYYPFWKEMPLFNGIVPTVQAEVDKTILILSQANTISLKSELIEFYKNTHVKTILLEQDAICDETFFKTTLLNMHKIDEIYFIAGHGELENGKNQGILALFNLIKILGKLHLLQQIKICKILLLDTQKVLADDVVSPFFAGLLGLSHVLAREYPTLSVSCIDIASREIARKNQALIKAILAEPPHQQAECIALRNGQRYQRMIQPVHFAKDIAKPAFRENGVYLIVGGGSGIGFEFSHYLAKHFKARLVWIARSPQEKYQTKISTIEALAGEVLYFQADVSDLSAMQGVVQLAKSRFGQIHGAIHSALLLKDKTIASMSEDEFCYALSPKMQGSVILHAVLKHEPLDFLLYFSSILSFMGSTGQSNYLAGCTFQDAWAQSLSTKSAYPVKNINWGYWGSVGSVATPEYQLRMNRLGLHSIEADQGIAFIEQLLTHPTDHLVIVKAKDELLTSIGLDTATKVVCHAQSRYSYIKSVANHVQTHIPASAPSHTGFAELDSFNISLLLYTFQRMGVFHRKNETFPIDQLQQQLGILPKYTRLLHVLLTMLEKAKILTITDDIITSRLIDSLTQDKLVILKNTFCSTYPHLQKHVDLAWACLMAYPDVLTGKRSHMEVLFPEGSLSLVEGIYQGHDVANYYNHCVARAISSYVSERLSKNPLNEIVILELGAGTGGTTAQVLKELADIPAKIRFIYTDISLGFIKFGEQQWREQYPWMTFQKLDIEQDTISQGFALESIDIVYASNVCHATKKISQTLQHVKQLLKTHGLFVLNEIVRRSDFATLTFGLTDGWWLFEDNYRIAGSPLLSIPSWKNVLSHTGFNQFQLLTQAENDQAVMVAESDGLCQISSDSSEVHTGVRPNFTAVTARQTSEAVSITTGVPTIFEVENFLKNVFARVLKLKPSAIENHQTFENYGVDSLITLEINKELSQTFGPLPASLLFEFMTINKLANYFIQAHLSSLTKIPGVAKQEKNNVSTDKNSIQDVAIIGCTGQYPGAKNLQEFWDLLQQGRSAIQTIPADRWDWQTFFDSALDKPGKSYSKWGGFIDDVDKFDPLFFTISPAEAERMDPQERIFLQIVWAVFEDAGYTREALEKIAEQIGVFVGVMNHDYSLYSVRSAYWSIANRISYYFGLHGPSLAVDTACSSSLTALHLAYQAICRGECELALAGGVNLILHPDHFINLCQLHMLSKSDTCRSFGANADGFVVGEGAGVVLLKPLQKAIADGDSIYGVIKGTAMNAGGKTSGYMVPNPTAQAALIQKAMQQAHVLPTSISYIEAHGTGTALGDPVEIAGLKRAFGKRQSNFSCAIGSVKSNIGHLESAAGIASVTKVLLQFKYKKWVPSLHAEKLNPHIDFANTSFHIQRELTDWHPPLDCPRRAGISSFGAGGANVHIILEEAPQPLSTTLRTSPKPYYLVLLSAKTPGSLKQRANDLVDWLKKATANAPTLEEISYTLHARRQHFDWRCAMVVESIDELITILPMIEKHQVHVLHKPIEQQTIDIHALDTLDYREKLISLADFYHQGYAIDWQMLYGASIPAPISLPTYPFLKERYWISAHNELDVANLQEENTNPIIQPLAAEIMQMVARLLKIKLADLSPELPLSEYGIDSIGLTGLTNAVNERYQLALTPAILYEHQTIASFAHFLNQQLSGTGPDKNKFLIKNNMPSSMVNDIAIIGMSGVFPGAENLEQFWENLIHAKDSIQEIPADRWNWQTFYGDASTEKNRTKIKWGGFIETMTAFDAAFFNMSPREAELTDPQQRVFLQTVWKAIEDAGYSPNALAKSKTGVFVGAVNDDYTELLLKNNITDAHITTGTTRSMIANRVSYLLNLQGPSVTMDTACSSSLVAIHQAIQAIQQGDCIQAIVGGVNALLSPSTYLAASKANMLSETGRCHTFDKQADGYVRAEGVGALLLKPLALAKADGDHIYAVIKGSAVNHGGHVNSLTAPNPNAQAEVIAAAYQKATVSVETITYIEAHGTGTALGDPIEINGLKKAFSQATKQHYCGLGSVKTHIGHLESAAGIASIIKVLLAMQHAELPGNLHFQELNPFIELEQTPFYLLTQKKSWNTLTNDKGETIPRRAGVSAFGFGGVNAHLVLEEAFNSPFLLQNQKKPYYLITLSAKQQASLEKLIVNLRDWLKQHGSHVNLESLSFTLNVGRSHHKLRCAMIVSSIAELIIYLNELSADQKPTYCIMGTLPAPDISGPVFQEIYKMACAGMKEYVSVSPELYREKLFLFADLYSKQFAVSWDMLHGDEEKRRVAGLPTYPFVADKHWFGREDSNVGADVLIKAAGRTHGSAPTVGVDLHDTILDYLKNIFAEKIKLSVEKIAVDETYEIYGVESLLVLEITQRLEQDLGTLPKTLLYEKRCIQDLAIYLRKKHSAVLEKMFGYLVDSVQEVKQDKVKPSVFSTDVTQRDDIAIVGLSGLYPMAKDLHEFGLNLKNGRDCISSIPRERWNYEDYPVSVGGEEKYYQYGGFLDDFDKFDPLFFNISPREAALMDPQERLFLQTAWATLEDAGYTRARLQQTVNNQVGVFVGVTYNFYPLFIAEEWQKGNRVPLDIQLFSIANRVSYFMNFSGPSFIVDTACSSSLAAIHLAYESIQRGECKMALAGGVNLSLHPCKYHALGHSSFLSDNGRCVSFGADGSGYVPGEGVGAVLLKPLKLAIQEGDSIYGIIKSSSINHGGKTSGYTVPNPSAQADLIKTAFKKANINPRTLSYMEAHGTGTSLGDPIEIRGLQEAFEEFTEDKQFCALGSVKSNIGHLESAAGISQLTKVLLQLREKKIFPSLHSGKPNPYIDFAQTPFFVQQTLTDWPLNPHQPRRAGMSSFGAGGTNVHLIVEEYIPPQPASSNFIQPEFLLVLSALNMERLQDYVKSVIEYLQIEKNRYSSETELHRWLTDICFTAQTGREAMSARLAVVASSYDHLLTQLQSWLMKQTMDQLWVNPATKDTQVVDEITHLNYEKLAQLWVNGAKISWELLYKKQQPHYVSFPTYPFAKRTCWITEKPLKKAASESLPNKIDKLETTEDVNEWLYATHWQQEPLHDNVVVEQENSHWLIFSDHELGLHLQGLLSKSSCTYCFSGERFEKWDDNVFYINDENSQDYELVFKEVHAKNHGKLTGIIILGTFFAKENASRSLFYFCQSVIQQQWQNTVKLALVTRGSQSVHPSEPINFWQYPLWSLVRIFSSEQPNYQALLLDLDSKKRLIQDAAIIINEINHLDVQRNHMAFRGEKKYLLRLSPYLPQQKNTWQTPEVVLITGGLGALGSEVAHFLAREGTKYLLLTGTTALPNRTEWNTISDSALNEKIQQLLSLEKMGVKVKYVTVNIIDKPYMQEIIQQVEMEWNKPIDGVFHLAGITTDNIPIQDMSDELFHKVLSVKMQGALVLHELFQQSTLNCFVLFSSLSALPFFGIGGLSAYAMANAFLDGLALHRQQSGLAAISINWAPFADKGMSFNYNHGAFLEAIGMADIPLRTGMAILKLLLSEQSANIAIFKAHWEKFLRVNKDAKRSIFFANFVDATSHSEKQIIKIEMEQAIKQLTEILADLLYLEVTEIDIHTPFHHYGMDSIIGIHFVANLNHYFPDTVSPMDLYRYPTIEQLVLFIAKACNAPTKSHTDEDIFMQSLKDLKDDQIKKLIEEELMDLI